MPCARGAIWAIASTLNSYSHVRRSGTPRISKHNNRLRNKGTSCKPSGIASATKVFDSTPPQQPLRSAGTNPQFGSRSGPSVSFVPPSERAIRSNQQASTWFHVPTTGFQRPRRRDSEHKRSHLTRPPEIRPREPITVRAGLPPISSARAAS